MVTYLAIIIISTALAFISKIVEERTKNKKLVILLDIIVVLFPSIIAGIRYNVGTDYAGVYKPIFDELVNGHLEERRRNIEIGYILINKLVIFLHGNFNIVMFICSLITNSCIYAGLKHYKDKINVPLGLFFFMVIFYQKSFNLVRQMMSIAIIFYGFKYLDIKNDEKMYENEKYKKKYLEKGKNIEKYKPRYKHSKEYIKYFAINYIKYFICVIIATLFQRTSLVMLIVPFVREIYVNPKPVFQVLKVLSFVLLLAIILNFDTIGKLLSNIESLEYYALYFSKTKASGLSIAYFIRILPVIVPFFFMIKKTNQDKQMSLIFSMNIIGAILLLLGYLTSTYGERLALFFSIFQIVLFPYYIRNFKNNKILFVLSIIALVSVNLAIWFYDYIYKKRDETVPYRTIFSINDNKEEKESNKTNINNNVIIEENKENIINNEI